MAEVLITLAIIGVVAALTLPTLIAKVNEKVDGNQKKVTEAKLIQGLNMLDLHGGINNTYSSTAEFAEELSKYMKITKICEGTNSAFTECIPYSEITYNNGTEDKTVEITKLNTADSISAYDTGVSASWDTTEVAKLGIDPSSVSYFYLWSSEEYSSTSISSRYRYFNSGRTNGDNGSDRRYSGIRFVCLGDT
ncbi:hypothetical protein IJ579_02155 [bacterium]|nr:hypothetical protein [bacterium]